QGCIRVKAQLEPLAVIETIDADDELARAEALPEPHDLRPIEVLARQRATALRVDADRERAGLEIPAIGAHAPLAEDRAADLRLRHALLKRQEIALGLESDDVVRRQRPQDVVVAG